MRKPKVKEMAALEGMRKEFENVDYPEKCVPNSLFALDDYTYVKFLKAREFSVEKAKKLLHDHVAYRYKLRPSDLTLSSPGVTQEALLMGVTRKGNPILFFRASTHDPSSYTVDHYVASRIFEIELARKELAKRSWETDRFAMMVDVSGYRLTKHSTPHALNLTKHMVGILQGLYRDTLEMHIILNAPAIFHGLWHVIKRWLKPDTAKRVLFINDVARLTEIIHPDETYQELLVLSTLVERTEPTKH